MDVWRVIIVEQDGVGGGKEAPYYFEDYDDAHDYYAFIKEQKGKPFYSSIYEPPTKVKFPINVCPKGVRKWRKS